MKENGEFVSKVRFNGFILYLTFDAKILQPVFQLEPKKICDVYAPLNSIHYTSRTITIMISSG